MLKQNKSIKHHFKIIPGPRDPLHQHLQVNEMGSVFTQN